MATHTNKIQDNKNSTVADHATKKKAAHGAAIQLEDNRPEALAQMKLQEIANNSSQVQQFKTYQAMADESAGVQQLMAVQEMADDHASQTIQQKEHTEEEIIQQVVEPLQRKKIQDSSQVVQRVVVPADLKGANLMAYKKIPFKLIPEDTWNGFLEEAADVADLAGKVTAFLATKEQEKKKAEADRKAAGAAKHKAEVEAAQAAAAAAAEARRLAEEERLAQEEIARLAAAAEAARIAQEAAQAAAAQAAEEARLKGLFKAGVHKVLCVDDVESYINNGYGVIYGEDYPKSVDNKVINYGIYINIRSKAGDVMTTHFHVHDGPKGAWSAHFKEGKPKGARQGFEVSKAESQKLFGLLGFNP